MSAGRVCAVVAGVFLLAALFVASARAQSDATAHEDGLRISDHVLPPDTYPHERYYFQFLARGNNTPPIEWRLEKGALPPGLKLETNGVLHGEPERPGEYRFTVSATDSGSPRHAVQRDFVIKVVEALTLVWKNAAHVAGGRIEGSVAVSNTTPDDIDLTFIVEAVAENGRATAIGYQHFVLPRRTVDKELPFGENLPHGSYVVNVDAIGEVAKRNTIFRQRMQTPKPLQVTVGP
ncbi:MAG TPA: Ig domain-containing protein [Candidatus Sulfotelmatobacter sp.]|nr:Ig domain-containing protein [Candidatus Sulfotelmatobacter sp.]